MQVKQMLIQELWLVLTQAQVCLQVGSIWFESVDKGKTWGCPLCEVQPFKWTPCSRVHVNTPELISL